jgi:hypothetical protein
MSDAPHVSIENSDAVEITGSNPVFVVGMNGSGTTMVLDHLDCHPQLYGFRIETKVLPYYLLRQSRYGDLREDDNFRRLFDEMRRAFPFRQANQGSPIELPAHWRNLQRTPAAIFDHLMKYFAAQDGKSRWCEKTPMHIMHIAVLARAWPGAQFIHVIRDGRDCAASFHRRWGYRPEASIVRWKRCLRAGRQQGVPLGERRYFEIQYEALTGNPEGELRKACDFLGVEFTAAMLESSRSGKRLIGLGSAKIRPNDRSYSEYFSEAQCERLEKIAGATLVEFGYSTRHPRSDVDPPSSRLRLWMFRDRVRIAASTVFSKLSNQRRISWNLIFGKLKRDLRHSRFDDS